MRYAGGGVGHYKVALPDTPADAKEYQEDFAVNDDVTADSRLTDLEEGIIVAEAAGLEEVEEAERIQDDDIKDDCSDSEGEEDDPDEDDLGAEDGEGGFLDAEDNEGYAAL